VEELKPAIVTEWQKVSQRFIDNSINDWRGRLDAVINTHRALQLGLSSRTSF